MKRRLLALLASAMLLVAVGAPAAFAGNAYGHKHGVDCGGTVGHQSGENCGLHRGQ